MPSAPEARELLASAELLFSAEEVDAAVRKVARELNSAYADKHPLVLSVMGGAVVFTGQILPLLTFPLEFDILQVTRYGQHTSGQALNWRVAPRANIAGRDVLVLDDILDEGVTLAAIRDLILTHGPASCKTAVFSDKAIGKPKPIKADFVGLTLPDRFVFGFGMDVKEAWRNLPAIYAIKDQ
jgi:hypoxanthine phosphoribosyltransferase